MDINIEYVVYELNNIMGNEEHKSLSEVRFENCINSFETEEDAINTIANDDDCMYVDFVILKKVQVN